MDNSLPIPQVPLKPLTLAIVGAGNRGLAYAAYALEYPKWVKIVAVVDHHDFKCHQMAQRHGIPPENIYVGDWSLMAKRAKFCDAVAICTTDQAHTEPALAFADLKYHILLEKPMSINVSECVQIYNAVTRNNVILAVGHVLRYTPYTTAMMKVLDSKVLGEVINIQHLEPVGFWHFAHSFVRGNWHNEKESTFSLLAKSCHDIDLVSYLMKSRCKKISSFGNLTHFKKENKPKAAGGAVNCLDCKYEPSCPYSAKKVYITPFLNGLTGWPVDIVQPKGVIDIENLTDALRKGDYGRCVYEMNNDVCDHQVVNMEFEDGKTVSFSMVAFTEAICQRKTRIYGTHGELEGNGQKMRVVDFVTGKTEEILPVAELSVSGHGGGDFGLMQAFTYACVTGNPAYIKSGPKETLDSHLYVFAAEESRLKGTVIDMNEYRQRVLSQAQ